MTKKSGSKTDSLDSIGKRIAEKRKERGISQAQLAEKVHASQSLIAKIETEGRNIQNDLLIKIASVLDTNTDYILRGTDTQNINTVDDLHLSNESVNNLQKYLNSDWLMELDSVKDAVNFFLSDRNGFNMIAQLYVYLMSDCTNIITKDKKNLQTDTLRIPLKSGLQMDNVSVSYHLSSEDFSDMLLQKIIYNLKQWRSELKEIAEGR